MRIWEESSFQLIGGSWVTVLLEESWEIDGPPHMEISTHFAYPIEGETHVWSCAYPLSDYLTDDYMKQEFRQEVARWGRLASHGE
jgi:hypothetical protein